MAKKKPVITAKSYPRRAADVPVTQRMLYLVRDELKSDTKSLEYKLTGKIEQAGLLVQEQITGLTSQIHQMRLLIEEQNARNNIVLDGLTNLFHRQDRVEHQLDAVEKVLLGPK